ncbi:beta-1,4 N-acetylgalactosaminyltransferase 1-like [Saccoglossus kowalevskii]|uniref:Beta-1,4 N-acetylgalactosaminyltransferase 1-like n=1 Tax=Saccoglossus kowalevskii TaxID=10224 RepID=A0ABM0H0M1_SACKO|nr:PREDICTED: beta-1,4 N-acetylgalactosaminyltransferase 1-like [Saccoglossus kowalevskii]
MAAIPVYGHIFICLVMFVSGFSISSIFNFSHFSRVPSSVKTASRDIETQHAGSDDPLSSVDLKRYYEDQSLVDDSETEESYRTTIIKNSRQKCYCSEPKNPEYREQYNRRMKEAKVLEREDRRREEPLAICKSMSPLNYVGIGLKVEPLQMVPIAGLSVHRVAMEMIREHPTELVIRCLNGMGTVHVKTQELLKTADLSDVTYSGNSTGEFSIHFPLAVSTDTFQSILDNLWYESTMYDIDAWEKLEITLLKFKIHLAIHIKRVVLPDLFDTKSGSVVDKVTLITKTFERYPAVHRLIDSVHKFYPDMKIVVADDSENPVKIERENVRHYFMPFREGYFAGRNLALSQVRTKFAVYVDDDMFFTDETKLEVMLEKLENPERQIDLVAAPVQGFDEIEGMFDIAYGDDGICILGMKRERIYVPGYPQCIYGEMFLNFFMAKTNVLKSVGFDPGSPPNRGHTEFWLDAVGKSQSVFCTDVNIAHEHKQLNTEKYLKYRHTKGLNTHMFFQNNLCYYFYLPKRFFGRSLTTPQ